ncbi:MAG: hypothetical protein WCQ16_11530 [Verrucomicrobiae bacterium]
MKATMELDNDLYRRAKVAAALRGRKIRELVAEGLRRVLEDSPGPAPAQKDGHFSGYWDRYFGVVKGEKWENPASQSPEKREEW